MENKTFYTADDIISMIGETTALTKSNAQNTSVILNRIEHHDSLIQGLANSLNNQGVEMEEIKNDIINLKLNEEITTQQQETIIATAKKRVSEILGNNPLERQKYYKIFAGSLYSDAKNCAGMGSKIACTKKGDFQRVIAYIEAWNPRRGCSYLKKKADENAKARVIARENGYIN